MLIVPADLEEKLLTILKNKRCGNPDIEPMWISDKPCNPSCKYHQKNNKEVHYQKLTSIDRYNIASRWFDFLLNEDRILTHFYILGINTAKLDQSLFGDDDVYDRPIRIYNRFFRTCLQKSLKSYFYEYDKIIVDNIYHDNSEGLEGHTFFPWHSVRRLNNDDNKLQFNNDITFMNSDHRKSLNDYSHFIQYIDLILGAIFNALHFSSRNKQKVNIAKKIRPLLSDLMNNPSNFNSHYNYVGRMSIDFFPKHDLNGLDAKSLVYKYKRMDSFYKMRTILLNNQLSLF